jgi:KaiC/GvpD/RAD55 family RecA-like ATPase
LTFDPILDEILETRRSFVKKIADLDKMAAERRPSTERPVYDVASILERSRAGGPRFLTGLKPLDELLTPKANPTQVGIQTGRVVGLCGAPYQGKSVLADQLALQMAKHGLRVVMLVEDEPREDAAERIGQGLGFRHAELNPEYPSTILSLKTALDDARFDLTLVPDPDDDGPRLTIEMAAERLLSVKNDLGYVLVVDSLHSSRTDHEQDDDSPRAAIGQRIRAFKALRKRGVLVIYTAEASRAAYASRDASQRTQAIAAGAEARDIEYGSDLLLFLSPAEDETVQVEVPKNRVSKRKGEFVMRLDPGPARFHGVDETVVELARKEKEDTKLMKLEDEIVKVILANNDFMTGRRIEDEHLGRRTDVRAAIRSALAKGKLVRREAPGKRGGGGFVYGPPGERCPQETVNMGVK